MSLINRYVAMKIQKQRPVINLSIRTKNFDWNLNSLIN